MTKSEQLPANAGQPHRARSNRIGVVFLLSLFLFDGIARATQFFAPGTMARSVFEYEFLAAVIGAIVIVLMPKVIALNIPFLVRLWQVTRTVLVVEGSTFVVTVFLNAGDGPAILDYWAHGWENGLWLIHAFMSVFVFMHLGYVLTGVLPSTVDSDDDIVTMYNTDGTPMTGGGFVDLNGNAYGCTSSDNLSSRIGSDD